MCRILVDRWPITDRGLYFRYNMTAEGLIAISTCSRISSASKDTVAYALLRNDQSIQLS